MMDLHCHSTFSDGTASPAELVALAKEAKLDLLALSDHDCIDGLPSFYEAAQKENLPVVYGVEIDVSLSGFDSNADIHLLGYGFDGSASGLLRFLSEQNDRRKLRNIRIIEKLGELGYSIDLSPYADKEGTLSRAHIAQTLVTAHHASSISDAFARFLGPDGIARCPVEKPDAGDLINLLHREGALCVLAHPMLLHIPVYESIESLASLGLDGVELYYPTHTAADIAKLRSFLIEHHLFPSTGSDYHGSMREGTYLGELAALAAMDPNIRETEERMASLQA